MTKAIYNHDLAVDMFRKYVEKEIDQTGIPKGDALDDLLARGREYVAKHFELIVIK